MPAGGKVALVTGGAQGIGRAIAARLAEGGARVFLSDIDSDKGKEAATAIGATFLRHDVAHAGDWAHVVQHIDGEAGALHTVVNNAAIEGDPAAAKDVERAPLADWQRIFAVNTGSLLLSAQATLPLLARSGAAAIITIGSVAALVPTPFLAAYGATKAAAEQFNRSLAAHCGAMGNAVRCNVVHPGHVRTAMLDAIFERMANERGVDTADFVEGFRASLPLRQFQDPADIAEMVAFLASDGARFVTGQAIAVDSGFSVIN